jgi:CubicO group peptidase (beta-lactamase class C family)
METVQPSACGFDAARLDHFVACMQNDIEREQYDGAVVLVARGGRVVLHQALGFAERASRRIMQEDDVFYLFSVTKAITASAILARVDRGQLALTTRVAEIIPEFASKGKQRVTIAQLLTHTAGMSAGFPPVAQEMMGNLEAVVAAVCQQGLDSLPGEVVSYSPITAHAVLGEVVHRLDGGERSLRQIFAEDIFTPLRMPDTALGLRSDLAARRVPVVVRDRREGLFPPEVLEGFNVMLQEDTEIPGGGGVGTAADIFRLAEMLRCGGELDGARILSPAVIRLAATNHTGLRPNNLWNYTREVRNWDEFPASLGLGFFVRGTGIFPTYFGTLASAGTFGGVGAGATLFWVDPARDLTFVCLTAGGLEEANSMERFQRLSDLVLAAAV